VSEAGASDRFLSTKSFHLVAAAAIAIAVAAVYSGTLHASFHFDDFRQIVENPWAKDPSRAAEMFLKKSRPLTLLSFALNYVIGGPGVEGYRAVNIVIHALNSVLAYFVIFLTLRLAGHDGAWPRRMALLVALIFAVHPVQTQAVTYIVQRSESLAAFFYLTGVLFFILALTRRAGAARWPLYAAVAVCYGLALLSKEVAITLPAVLALYDFYFSGSPRLRAVLSRWPLYAVLSLMLAYFAVTTVLPLGGFDAVKEKLMSPLGKEKISAIDLSLASTAHAEEPPAFQDAPAAPTAVDRGPVYVTSGFGIYGLGPREYMLTELNVLVYYMALLAVPANQNLDYDFPVARRLFEAPEVRPGTVLSIPVVPPIASLAVILVVLAIGCYLFARSTRTDGECRGNAPLVASFFIFWFFILLLPTSSFIPIIDVISEQRLYVASLGFFTVLAIAVDSFASFMVQRFLARRDTREV
jgi:hypothetical protein